jgi:hypothetical protein
LGDQIGKTKDMVSADIMTNMAARLVAKLSPKVREEKYLQKRA